MSDAPSRTQEHLTPEGYFGPEVAKAWRRAIEATHEFARTARARPGEDVIGFLDRQTIRFQKASRKDGASQQIPPQWLKDRPA